MVQHLVTIAGFELNAQRYASPRKLGIETARPQRFGRTGIDTASLSVILGQQPLFVTPQSVTVLRIHPGIVIQPIGIKLFALDITQSRSYKILTRSKFEHFRTVGRKVHAGRPFEVVGIENLGIQLNLHTAVANLTHVLGLRSKTGRIGQRRRDQHIFGTTGVPVDRTVQTVEQTEVDTDIVSFVGLPSQFAVLQLRRQLTGNTVVHDVGVQTVVCIGCNIVVTVHTIAVTQFQLIKYRFDILHEIFVVNIPRSAGSPESTPTSVGTELGATVRTNRTFYIITAFVIVFGYTEERNHRHFGKTVTHSLVFYRNTHRVVRTLLIHMIRYTLQERRFIRIGFLTDQHIQRMVVVEQVVISDRIRSSQYAILALGRVQRSAIRSRVHESRTVSAAGSRGILDRVVGTERQLLDRFPFQINGSVEFILLVVFVLFANSGDRVHVEHERQIEVVASVLVVSVHGRSQSHTRIEGIRRSQTAIAQQTILHIGNLHITAMQTSSHFQPFVQLGIEVRANLHLLETYGRHDTVRFIIRQ